MLTNNQIISQSNALFAHDARFNLPTAFANRVETRDEFQKHLTNNKNIIIVSDLLGSGKTFLTEMVQGNMNLPEEGMLLCGRCKLDDIKSRSHDDTTPVFIDEWDIKANPKKMLETLAHIEIFCSESNQPLVLIGDYTLRSTNMQEQLKEFNRNVEILELEALLPDFLRLALRNRVVHAFKSSIEDVAKYNDEPTALEQEWINFIDAPLFNALVPNWQVTPAVFRDVFRILSELSRYLTPDDSRCQIGKGHVRSWLTKQPLRINLEQRQFLLRFIDGVKQKEEVNPYTSEQLCTMFGIDDISIFTKDIIEPLVRMGVLVSMGKPYLQDGKYIRYPEPYLPGSKARIAAVYDIAL